jgi:hypothetical protein
VLIAQELNAWGKPIFQIHAVLEFVGKFVALEIFYLKAKSDCAKVIALGLRKGILINHVKLRGL